jgi:hypothetical protein
VAGQLSSRAVQVGPSHCLHCGGPRSDRRSTKCAYCSEAF